MIWWSMLLLLTLLPIPFGSYRPWAWSAMSLWAALLLAGWAISIGLGRRDLVWRPALVVPLILLGLVLLWIVVMTIPGWSAGHPIWQVASEQLGRQLPHRMAVSVDAALVALMRLLAYVAIFWLSLQYCRDPRRAETLLVCLSWTGLVLAIYGLINYAAGNPYLLWFERWTGHSDVTATFVNRNHYSTYAGMGVLASAAVGLTAYRSAWRLSDRSQPTLPRSIECLAGRPLVYFVIMLVISMAWLQSHSRMGTAATLLAVAAMFLMMTMAGLVRHRLVQWSIALLAVVFLFVVSGDLTLKRIGETTTDINRIPLFATVSEQIGGAPYTGSGYGSFSQMFLMYRDLRLPVNGTYLAAHNNYLELAAEIGIPATLGLVLAIAWCAALCAVGAFRRRRDQLLPIVAVAATILVGTHTLMDFSLQIPAVAAAYAAILGMGVAQSWSLKTQ